MSQIIPVRWIRDLYLKLQFFYYDNSFLISILKTSIKNFGKDKKTFFVKLQTVRNNMQTRNIDKKRFYLSQKLYTLK